MRTRPGTRFVSWSQARDANWDAHPVLLLVVVIVSFAGSFVLVFTTDVSPNLAPVWIAAILLTMYLVGARRVRVQEHRPEQRHTGGSGAPRA